MSHCEEHTRACSAYSVITVITEPVQVHQLEMIGRLSPLTVSMTIVLGQTMQLYNALELLSQPQLQALLLNQLGLHPPQWRFLSVG